MRRCRTWITRGALLVAATMACAADEREHTDRAGLVGDGVLPFAGCLPGGVVSICEDPITGGSPEATVVGGTMLPSGFRIDAKDDYITFDLGADATAGAVRFTLDGIGPQSLAHDTVVLLLATDTPALNDPEPTRTLELKIWGSAVMPEESGNTRFGAGVEGQDAVKSAGVLDYDPAELYEFDLTWDDATQRLTLARDGEMLLDFLTGDVIPGADNEPIDLRYRYVHLALPELNNQAFWPVVGGVYGSVSIAAATPSGSDTGTGGEGSSADAEDDASDDAGSSSAPSSTSMPGSSDGDAEPTGGTTTASSESGGLPGLGEPPVASGCGCAAADRSSGRLAVVVVLVLLAVGVVRRPRVSPRARRPGA